MAKTESLIQSSLLNAKEALDRFVADPEKVRGIARAAELFATSLKQGGRLYSCGNGGSMCDAMHFAEELTGRFRENRRGLAAVAISDPGFITCAANDFGYQEVFARFVSAHGRPGDGLLAISTSGKSENVLKAAREARAMGLKVVSLTGRESNELQALSDIHIWAEAGRYADRVQEIHIKIIHCLIEGIEHLLELDESR